MADDSVAVADNDDSKIVTKFLFDTCRLLQPTRHRLKAVVACCVNAGKQLKVDQCSPDDDVLDRTCVDDEIRFIPLITGSSAEFYIQPMLPCLGDVDIMYHDSARLAIPDGYQPPTELPAEFHSRLTVCEIIDSEHPGYVYLMLSYLLTEDSDAGKYNAVRYKLNQRHYASYIPSPSPEAERRGPALTTHGEVSFDDVRCIRCLSWPPQAADWLTRQRNHGWPDSATVDRVVNNGCDVVQVAHRQCRQDEFMSECQCRLSFSRAEIALLNSWTPVQQIVYHMLRILIKAKRLADITDSSGTTIISNYHFKTLMLWVCELKPQRWWTDDIDVVRICAKLLNIFADWLRSKICPHYFISIWSLIYNSVNSEIIVSQLSSITQWWLSTWFVNNYLRKCAQLCPDRVSRLFDDVSTRMKLQNAVSAVVDWRLNSALSDLCSVCIDVEYCTYSLTSRNSLTARSCNYWINELVKIDSCLHDCLTAVVSLHVANRIAKHSLSDELLDVLATALGKFVNKRRYCHQLSSELSLSQAVILMKDVANNMRSTVQKIEFELSQVYLYRALRCTCRDSDSDSIYCLANVYLAVLCYTSKQYQTTIDHCTLVMRSQNHSQCSSHVVQGNLLPKIDDNIDTVLGLAVFYQYIRMTALNQQQTQYVSVFTTELFAHYLYIKCLSVIKCRQFLQMLSINERHHHNEYIIDSDQLFIADVLLLYSLKMSSELKYRYYYKALSEQRQYAITNATGLETSHMGLVELLQQSAVEHLTTHRQLQAQRFSSVVTIVTTDFEALYAYKRGDYQQCLQLSTQNVHILFCSDKFINVSTFREFIQLMDDDIVSLTALTLIVNPECRDRDSNVCVYQMTLSLYLMTQCQLKLHHSVTSLAQTLDYIEVVRERYALRRTLDHLTLKLAERKIMTYLSQIM